MNKKPVLLISFHNQKALGVRYLEKSLKSAGYEVNIIFFKGFNSVKPDSASKEELSLLKAAIDKINPGLIGLSVMTSLYLETVYAVNSAIKSNFNNIPVLWGGVYATLFPEKCLEQADFVIRGEGEHAIIELTDAIYNNLPFDGIKNLAFKKQEGIIINEVRALCQNLDEFGYPEIGGDNKYYINNDKISQGDPQLNSVSFELTASRGCPFVCSYCCSVNLHRVYKGMGGYVRFRSVSSVMDELREAKSKLKNLKVVHFWDEIFSDDENWIHEFTIRYKREINLPFEIWGHPLKVNRAFIKSLVDTGLYKVVMGIQSGSPRVRKEIFHRVEKQEDIINASRILAECRVPQVIYDFMLQHPFETDKDIRQTYELCTQLAPPFELQLHGLNFLPGTDIVEKAVKMNILSSEDLEKIMYSPIQDQYNMYWGYKNTSMMSKFWYALTYMSQFGITRPVARYFANTHKSTPAVKLALILYKIARPLSRVRYLYKKGMIVLKAFR